MLIHATDQIIIKKLGQEEGSNIIDIAFLNVVPEMIPVPFFIEYKSEYNPSIQEFRDAWGLHFDDIIVIFYSREWALLYFEHFITPGFESIDFKKKHAEKFV